MYTWNILDDMFSMTNLLERAFGELSLGKVPAINLSQTDGASQIEALVPGLKQDEIEISFEKGVLTIATREQEEEEQPAGTLIREEYSRPRFRRGLRLANEIDSEGISASLEDGVLRVILPHKAASTPKKIEVQ